MGVTSWAGRLMPTFTWHVPSVAAEGSGASGTVSGVEALSVAPSWFPSPALEVQATVQLTLTFSLAAPESTPTDIALAEEIVVSRLQM